MELVDHRRIAERQRRRYPIQQPHRCGLRVDDRVLGGGSTRFGHRSDIDRGMERGLMGDCRAPPAPTLRSLTTFNSVSCVTSTLCWAVGEYQSGTGTDQTLVEEWDGTSWALVASPNTGPTDANLLISVACASSIECWAVGEEGPSSR